ncbi:MAG: hypothetical protein PF795_09605 [Kiritimatiellae bacterium]|jgi:hypothetical protein|nr:hypothetical protein [Kiritimatiellia bacterium]
MMSFKHFYLNDGTREAPKLRVYLNLDNLFDLPPESSWPGLKGEEALYKLNEDGFEGVQVTDLSPRSDVLSYCGLDRVNEPGEVEDVFLKHKDLGDSCITLHLAWGIENDAEVDRLVHAVLEASDRHQLPAFVETHRATITQDMWRTVQILQRHPTLLLNADYSHYYCGQELVYGDIDQKLDFMGPIFGRTGFMHGRIAAPGGMQMPIDGLDRVPRMATGVDYQADFKKMWILAMRGFLRNASEGDVLIFAPELLTSKFYYARVFPDAEGVLREESDRYAQALLYQHFARACFEEATSLESLIPPDSPSRH